MTVGAGSSSRESITEAASASETPSRWAKAVKERTGASPRVRRAVSRAGNRTLDPLIGFTLAHAEQASLHHLERIGFQVSEDEEQAIFWRRERTVPHSIEFSGGPMGLRW